MLALFQAFGLKIRPQGDLDLRNRSPMVPGPEHRYLRLFLDLLVPPWGGEGANTGLGRKREQGVGGWGGVMCSVCVCVCVCVNGAFFVACICAGARQSGLQTL